MRHLTLPLAFVRDFALTLFVEEHLPEGDGIWWQEDDAPFILSSPRGVIFEHPVQSWTKKPLPSGVTDLDHRLGNQPGTKRSDPTGSEHRGGTLSLLMSQDLPTNETMAMRRCGAIQCPLRPLMKLMSLDKKGNHTMGWWPVHYDLTTCDCIGDTPADILGDAFQQILAERAKQGQGKPLLREYLDAFAALLQAHGPHLYHRGRWLAVRHIVARIRSADGGLLKEIIGNPFHPSDEEFFTQCNYALEGITRAYWEDLGRNPRLREILATIEFVLSDEYCSDLLPTQLEEVAAITRRVSPLEYLCFSLYGLYARMLGLFEWW